MGLGKKKRDHLSEFFYGYCNEKRWLTGGGERDYFEIILFDTEIELVIFAN